MPMNVEKNLAFRQHGLTVARERPREIGWRATERGRGVNDCWGWGKKICIRCNDEAGLDGYALDSHRNIMLSIRRAWHIHWPVRWIIFTGDGNPSERIARLIPAQGTRHQVCPVKSLA